MNKKIYLLLIILIIFSLFITISSNKRNQQIPIAQFNRPPQTQIKIKIAFNVISEVIPHALEVYESDNKLYPTTEQGLDALIKKPTREPIPSQWKKAYLTTGYIYPWKNLNDPWDNLYTYTNSNNLIKITSLGPDGQENTEDDLVIEFPIEDYSSIMINRDNIPSLTEKIRSTIEPNVKITSLKIEENGEFILQGHAEKTTSSSSKQLTRLVTVLRTNPLFHYVKLLPELSDNPHEIKFTISGVFVGNLDHDEEIEGGFNKLNYYLHSQCLKFGGFQNPSSSKCNFGPQNLTYKFNQAGTSVTFNWESGSTNRDSDFYWFCCSCEDSTSHSFSVSGESYTLSIDPKHEYAYSVSCRDRTGILECSSPLEAIQFANYQSTR